ncbi:hypothetical protein [Micromonospora sp. NPDC126480]|uniref:hypothetical protein n=1 Tax=Micromonospora sp. NPDC126480 TaxID=3155312 RepID=UPI003324C9D3
MTGALPFAVGDVVDLAEQHYCYGLGKLTLRIVELGRREQHSDGLWIHLRGVDLGDPRGPRQRRVLARIDAVRPAAVQRPAAHLPARPSWTCTGCGQAWPCPDRRRRLLERYAIERITLHVYLGTQLAEAASDLRQVPPALLYERFLGWLPDRRGFSEAAGGPTGG